MAEPGAPAPAAMGTLRPVWAEVDLAAVRHNVALLVETVAPAAVCAVVKADAYGHGAEPVARACLEAGATSLAVAIVDEGAALRRAGVEAPVLLLSEPGPDAVDAAVAAGLTPTLYSPAAVAACARAAEAAGRRVDVQVKVDTGMHRVGADPDAVAAVAAAVAAEPALRLTGLWTHLAVADSVEDGDRAFTAGQLARFAEARRAVAARVPGPLVVHAANSAGALAHPDARLDLVRCGIAVYGSAPSPALAGLSGGLRPALSWRARVSMVRRLPAGARPSYGRCRPLPADAVVATVPVGYADGVPRRYFSAGGTVLIGGRRRPLAGTVTMDQIVVDCGDDDSVTAGDEVVLIGRQGEAELTAWDWAATLDTISYEVLCGIGPRVPRVPVVRGAR